MAKNINRLLMCYSKKIPLNGITRYSRRTTLVLRYHPTSKLKS